VSVRGYLDLAGSSCLNGYVIFFLIPFVNVAMLYILAKGKWPIEYERDALVEENKKLKQGIPTST